MTPFQFIHPIVDLLPLCIIDENATVVFFFFSVRCANVFNTYINVAKDKTDRNTRGTLLLIVHCQKILVGKKFYCVEKTKGKAKLSTR